VRLAHFSTDSAATAPLFLVFFLVLDSCTYR
jgi:hypothetical protein